MHKNNKTTTLNDLWHLFLVIVIPVVCVSGISLIPYMIRPYLIYATGIFFVLAFILSDVKIQVNAITVLSFLLVSYMGISIIYSYDKDQTISYFILYLCIFTLLFIDLPTNLISKILTIMYVISVVIAFSIILSAFVENCMLNFFSFIVNPTHSPEVVASIKRELSAGAYSGFAREKAEAAYIMNIGIAILFSKYFSEKKLSKKDFFFLVVYLVALMLTGKRTLFLVVIICFLVYMAISKVRSKFFKVACVVLLTICAFLLIMAFVPKLANIFDRLMDENNVETFGNRDMLWDYLYLMIRKFPLFGAGFGSYNSFAYDNGLLVGGHQWKYNGHNSYLQALGELGIVGATIFLLLLLVTLVISLRLLKANLDNVNHSKLLYFSIYIQLLLLVYGMTGNPIYTKQMMFCWFFSANMVLHIYRSTKKDHSPNTNNLYAQENNLHE